MVVIAASLPKLALYLREQGFKTEEHQHSLNVRAPGSDLRIQFTTDERYQAFLARCVDGDVLGLRVKVASWRMSRKGSFGPTPITAAVEQAEER